MEKPTICIGENKGADQLRSNRKADQRLCFRYLDSTIPLLPYSHAYNPQFFCSDCGVQNLVHILYKNTKFQTFFF